MEQALEDFGGQSPPLLFIPHLLPTVRGIYASLYVPLKDTIDPASLLSEHWQDERFLEVLGETPPQLAHVIGGNRVQNRGAFIK